MKLNNGFARLLAVAGLTLTLGATVATAQDTIDPSGEPAFGGITLETGFAPDPFIVSAVSGGSLDAASLDLGDACLGFVESAPDFRVQWNGDSDLLRFYFASDGDATMVVSGPNGVFCNDDADDDFEMLNPLVEFVNPANGAYNIWIGSYEQSEYIPGYLLITTLPVGEIAPIQSDVLFDIADIELGYDIEGTEEPTDVLLPDADPNYERASLAPAFAPQPYALELLAGGWINAAALNTGADCVGYIAEVPDVSLVLDGAMQDLNIAFVSEKNTDDTTMVIRDSSGRFYCDDDSGEGLAPLVVIDAAAAGEYDIWVGTYEDTGLIRGQLTVSEGSAPAPTPQPSATPLPTLDPVMTATHAATLLPQQAATATATPVK